MTWATAQLKAPTKLAALVSQLTSAASAINNNVDSSLALINTSLPLVGEASPTAFPPFYGHTEYTDSIAHKLNVFFVHPWVEGAGEGDGYVKNLSTANALAFAAKKLVDKNDIHLSSSFSAFVLVVSALSLKDYASKLQTLNAVFNWPSVQVVLNKTNSLITLETDKTVLPTSQNTVRINSTAFGVSTAHRVGLETTVTVLSITDSAEANTAKNELLNLAEKKKARVAAENQVMQQMLSIFHGQVGYAKFVQNCSNVGLASELMSNAPSAGSPFSFVAIFTGQNDVVQNLADYFI